MPPFPLLALLALYWSRLGRGRRWRRRSGLGVNTALPFLEASPALTGKRSRGLRGLLATGHIEFRDQDARARARVCHGVLLESWPVWTDEKWVARLSEWIWSKDRLRCGHQTWAAARAPKHRSPSTADRSRLSSAWRTRGTRARYLFPLGWLGPGGARPEPPSQEPAARRRGSNGERADATWARRRGSNGGTPTRRGSLQMEL